PRALKSLGKSDSDEAVTNISRGFCRRRDPGALADFGSAAGPEAATFARRSLSRNPGAHRTAHLCARGVQIPINYLIRLPFFHSPRRNLMSPLELTIARDDPRLPSVEIAGPSR